jgi:Coenzyme A transferase
MKKLISAAEAAGMVKDGMTVMIGGFLGNGSPHAIIDALVESGVKDLTLIVNDTAYPDKGCGRLIAGKQVRKVIVSHIGTNPCTSEQMNSGELEIEFCPQGTLAERVRSGGAGLGGVLTPVGLGTIVAEGKQSSTSMARIPARKTAAGRRSPARREPGRPIGQPGL